MQTVQKHPRNSPTHSGKMHLKQLVSSTGIYGLNPPKTNSSESRRE